jgi:hypothetical protein
MWKRCALFALVVAVAVLLIVTFKKKEKFSFSEIGGQISAAIDNLVKSKPKLSPKGLTAAITNLAVKENPKPMSPKAGFEMLTGEEADDSKYTPGFYKIQKTFPALTKRTLRKFNIEA